MGVRLKEGRGSLLIYYGNILEDGRLWITREGDLSGGGLGVNGKGFKGCLIIRGFLIARGLRLVGIFWGLSGV